MNCNQTIDPDMLMEIACDDRDMAIELLNLFFEQTRQEMERLHSAAAQNDAETASLAAHKIAGSAGSCGLAGMAGDLRELEQLCKEGLPQNMEERLATLNRQLDEARCFFETRLECRLT